MAVGLMADVPDELVRGERKDAVERECQLDRAEVRREVPAVLRDRIDDERRSSDASCSSSRTVSFLTSSGFSMRLSNGYMETLPINAI
mgnify:CR=1 FL=1